LSKPLPGKASHRKLIPALRLKDIQSDPPSEAVSSAVLILLYPVGNEIYTVAILRSEYDGAHSGQISLPGGRWEPSDRDLVETAIRETQEEIGVNPTLITFLGSLSELYISRSNHLVYPAVAYSSDRPLFKADPFEVQEVIEINLESLIDSTKLTHKTLRLSSDFSMEVPGYLLGEHFIWGATAMIFAELIDVIREMEFTAKH